VRGRDSNTVAALVNEHGGIVTSRLNIIDSVGALLSHAQITTLVNDNQIVSISPNSPVATTGYDRGNKTNPAIPTTNYPDVIGADYVWDQGVIGKGVTVALLDTGLDQHSGIFKDVNGRPGRVLDGVDFISGKNNYSDKHGHGTHIAGIIANTQIGEDGEWNGIAPGVNLVPVRVLDKNGVGTYEQAIQGIQWVIEHKVEYNIRVLNVSLIAAVQSPYWADPLNQAITRAWAEGITVVAAAGNDGPSPISLGVPANNPYVITVGAFTDNFTPYYWDDDYLAPWSGAGPTLDGFVKPDLVAPGGHITSTMLPSSTLFDIHEGNRTSGQYFTFAGTSQSAGVVSGVAALILSHQPTLTPDEVKYRIMISAFPWFDAESNSSIYSVWQQGAGRVNAPGAVFAEVEGSANQGMDIWADLAGEVHYEGYSYFDADTNTFRLRGDFEIFPNQFGTWAGQFGTWAGQFGTWAGQFGTWAGQFGTWAGQFGTWAGQFGTWAGQFGTWAGQFGTWAGQFGTWAGGYYTWAGGVESWSGTEPWANTLFADPNFIQNFTSGGGPPSSYSSTSISQWVPEP
jgi:serine protease AprX